MAGLGAYGNSDKWGVIPSNFGGYDGGDKWGAEQHYNYGGVQVNLPPYINALGDAVSNVAVVAGPHAGNVCDCAECKQYNEDHSTYQAYGILIDKVRGEAHSYARKCEENLSQYGTHHIPYAIRNSLYEMFVMFASKQLADYQKDIIGKIQNMQLAHAEQVRNLKRLGNAPEVVKPVSIKDGRVFLEDGQ